MMMWDGVLSDKWHEYMGLVLPYLNQRWRQISILMLFWQTLPTGQFQTRKRPSSHHCNSPFNPLFLSLYPMDFSSPDAFLICFQYLDTFHWHRTARPALPPLHLCSISHSHYSLSLPQLITYLQFSLCCSSSFLKMENFFSQFSTSSVNNTSPTTVPHPYSVQEPVLTTADETHFNSAQPQYWFNPTENYIPAVEPVGGESLTQFPAADPVYPFSHLGQNEDVGLPEYSWSVKEQERYMSRMARYNRKLARQRSINKNSASGAMGTNAQTIPTHASSADFRYFDTINNRDLYQYFTPDNRRLKYVLKKELRTSDVGSLGRIVLPKREAEQNLPAVNDREGIELLVRDAYNPNRDWCLKYKFWVNNQSRMYVLENTCAFVKQNKLAKGDVLVLYEDEGKNLFFAIDSARRPTAEASPSTTQATGSYSHTNQTNTIANYSSTNRSNTLANYINDELYAPYMQQELQAREAQPAYLPTTIYNTQPMTYDGMTTHSDQQQQEAYSQLMALSTNNVGSSSSLNPNMMVSAEAAASNFNPFDSVTSTRQLMDPNHHPHGLMNFQDQQPLVLDLVPNHQPQVQTNFQGQQPLALDMGGFGELSYSDNGTLQDVVRRNFSQ